jgi:hypothetical protein
MNALSAAVMFPRGSSSVWPSGLCRGHERPSDGDENVRDALEWKKSERDKKNEVSASYKKKKM